MGACHICTGIGPTPLPHLPLDWALTAATSTPGLGPLLPHLRTTAWDSKSVVLCAGTGLDCCPRDATKRRLRDGPIGPTRLALSRRCSGSGWRRAERNGTPKLPPTTERLPPPPSSPFPSHRPLECRLRRHCDALELRAGQHGRTRHARARTRSRHRSRTRPFAHGAWRKRSASCTSSCGSVRTRNVRRPLALRTTAWAERLRGLQRNGAQARGRDGLAAQVRSRLEPVVQSPRTQPRQSRGWHTALRSKG